MVLLLSNLLISAVDFLEHVLTMDPTDRYSAIEALTHPYVAKFSDPSDEVCLFSNIYAIFYYRFYIILQPVSRVVYNGDFEAKQADIETWKS